MRRHIVEDATPITDMIETHRIRLASGPGFGRANKFLEATLHRQFYVMVDGVERWHGTDITEAIAAYNNE